MGLGVGVGLGGAGVGVGVGVGVEAAGVLEKESTPKVAVGDGPPFSLIETGCPFAPHDNAMRNRAIPKDAKINANNFTWKVLVITHS